MTKDTTFFRRLGVLLLLAVVNVFAAMAADVYNSALNQLTIPSVQVGNSLYTNCDRNHGCYHGCHGGQQRAVAGVRTSLHI
jgi:hypothetical protein